MPNFPSLFNLILNKIQQVINLGKLKNFNFSILEFGFGYFNFSNRKTLAPNNNYIQQQTKWQPAIQNVALPVANINKYLSKAVTPLKENTLCSGLWSNFSFKEFRKHPLPTILQGEGFQIFNKVFQGKRKTNLANFQAVYTIKAQYLKLGSGHLLEGTNHNSILTPSLPNGILINAHNISSSYGFSKTLENSWQNVLWKISTFHNKNLPSVAMVTSYLEPNLGKSAFSSLANIPPSFGACIKEQIPNYSFRSWQIISKFSVLNNQSVVSLNSSLIFLQNILYKTIKPNHKTLFQCTKLFNKPQALLQNILQQNISVPPFARYKVLVQNYKGESIKIKLNQYLGFNKELTKLYQIKTTLIRIQTSASALNLLPTSYKKGSVAKELQDLSKKVFRCFNKVASLQFSTWVRLSQSLQSITNFSKNISVRLKELPTTTIINKSTHYNHNNNHTKIVNNANVTVYNNGKQSVPHDIVEATNKSFQQMRLASTYGK